MMGTKNNPGMKTPCAKGPCDHDWRWSEGAWQTSSSIELALGKEIGRLRVGIIEEAARCRRIGEALDQGAGGGRTRGARMTMTARRLLKLLATEKNENPRFE
jgi:hypothetical protein